MPRRRRTAKAIGVQPNGLEFCELYFGGGGAEIPEPGSAGSVFGSAWARDLAWAWTKRNRRDPRLYLAWWLLEERLPGAEARLAWETYRDERG